MSTTIDLSGKVALVTGAGRGIGREIGLALAAAGADIAINDFAAEDACLTMVTDVERLGVRALCVMGDVGDEANVDLMIERVEKELGPLDIVVNNAGITRDNLVARMSPDEFDVVIRTHLRGTFLISKAASRKMMRRRDGVIINISSVVGRRGNAGQANYAAAKAGIIGLTKSLARELGARNIRVNAIAPGYIDTPMTQALPDEARQAIVDNTPLKLIGAPSDVASAVLFLASPLARFVTGAVLPVDGGLGICGAGRHTRRMKSMQQAKRVVVTGMGCVTPLGCDVQTVWRRLLAAESGVVPISRFDASDMSVRIAAEVQDFDPVDYLTSAPRGAWTSSPATPPPPRSSPATTPVWRSSPRPSASAPASAAASAACRPSSTKCDA